MTIKTRVLQAVMSGRCNTTRDVADETGLPVKQCSRALYVLAQLEYVKQTNRWIENGRGDGTGGRFRVFEVRA